MQPLRVRLSIEDFSKDDAFYRIDLSEYNVDAVINVYIDGRLVRFYYDNKKELGVPIHSIDLYIIMDKSVYIDFYSVMENRDIQLEKLGID
jgi:hypothetical protein